MTRAWAAFALLLLLASSAWAAEFQVNTYTIGRQMLPDAAIDADGDFVVVWGSAQDGDGDGVFAQRFNSTGVAVAAEFQVNTYTTGTQYYPSVGMASSGAFVVTWTSYYDQDGNGYGVFARRFSSSGTALATEFQVNVVTAGYQADARVAVHDDGQFVIVWAGENTDGNGYATVGRLWNSSGTALATEFQVNTYITGDQEHAWPVWLTTGGFIVAWQSPQDGNSLGIFAQRYDSSGAAVASEFQVNTVTQGQQSSPSVAALPGGSFVIVWTGETAYGSSSYGRRFNSSGTALATEFTVNDFYATGAHDRAQVSSDTAGNLVVVWYDNQQEGEPNMSGVFGRRYDSSGASVAVEFQVNTYTPGNQFRPLVAMSDDGSFVIAWDGADQDGDNRGIFADFTEGPTPTATLTPTVTSTPTKTSTPTSTPTVTMTPTPCPTAAVVGGGHVQFVGQSNSSTCFGCTVSGPCAAPKPPCFAGGSCP